MKRVLEGSGLFNAHFSETDKHFESGHPTRTNVAFPTKTISTVVISDSVSDDFGIEIAFEEMGMVALKPSFLAKIGAVEAPPTIEKLDPKADGSSLDILGQNIETMRSLFPEVFTEGSDDDGPRWKVDIEKLGELLGEFVEDKPERYSFNWNGKSQVRRIAQTPSTGTLRPCPDESVNWDKTQNMFIEGDNLEVLKLLQKTYHNQVKMIYIAVCICAVS